MISKAPIYDFFNPDFDEESVVLKLEVYNFVSIASILARYEKHFTIDNSSPLESKKRIAAWAYQFEANQEFYEER